jgi:hypothetical protein
MFDALIPMFFGWPAILLSVGFALTGIFLKRHSLSIVSGVLILLPAWYLGHYSVLFLSLPLFLFGAGYEISRGRAALAYLLVAPALVLIGALGVVVLTQ